MSGVVQLYKRSTAVPLLLENVPDTPEDREVFDHYPYAEPDKVSKLIVDNDVYFLLDLTHAKITAEYRQWDLHDYLRALPLDRVKEIHVCGAGRDDRGYPTDPHLPMAEDDYALLEWALGHTEPDVVTLEYPGVGNDSPEGTREQLVIQLARLTKILNG